MHFDLSIWGVADGARIVNVDGEIIAYAVLDILAKPVFGFWLLTTHDKNAQTSPSIEGFWSHGATTEGTLRVSTTKSIQEFQIY
jgi:bacteriorhodopsin